MTGPGVMTGMVALAEGEGEAEGQPRLRSQAERDLLRALRAAR
jgi:hypothetical protein